jgi:hypothetical protein
MLSGVHSTRFAVILVTAVIGRVRKVTISTAAERDAYVLRKKSQSNQELWTFKEGADSSTRWTNSERISLTD